MKENTDIKITDVTDKIKIISIPEDIVEDIQKKDIAVTLDENIIAMTIDIHETNKKDEGLLNKPLLKAYQKDLISKQVIFERAKNDLYNKYIPKEFKQRKFNWELDYMSCNLFIVFEE